MSNAVSSRRPNLSRVSQKSADGLIGSLTQPTLLIVRIPQYQAWRFYSNFPFPQGSLRCCQKSSQHSASPVRSSLESPCCSQSSFDFHLSASHDGHLQRTSVVRSSLLARVLTSSRLPFRPCHHFHLAISLTLVSFNSSETRVTYLRLVLRSLVYSGCVRSHSRAI